jgi:hypothetical protein
MAPRSTRPNSRTNPPVTRKRGESDPNEPPKRRKTRNSRGATDDEREAGEDDDEQRKVVKGARRVVKARYVFFFKFFRLSFSFSCPFSLYIYSNSLTQMIFETEKPPLLKTKR